MIFLSEKIELILINIFFFWWGALGGIFLIFSGSAKQPLIYTTMSLSLAGYSYGVNVLESYIRLMYPGDMKKQSRKKKIGISFKIFFCQPRKLHL